VEAAGMTAARGFVFSYDALLAVMIFGIVLAGLSITPEIPQPTGLSTGASDIFRLLENDGTLQKSIDVNSLTIAAQDIHTKAASLLSGRGLRVEITQFSLDEGACRQEDDFESCFPEEERLHAAYGDGLPEDRLVISRHSVVAKKQPPGDCNIEYLSFDGGSLNSIWENEGIKLFFAPHPNNDPEDVGLTVDVNTSPAAELACDNNLEVNLSVKIEEDLREIVDIMLVIDKSQSMDNCAITGGTAVYTGSGSVGGGIRVCTQPGGEVFCNLLGGWSYEGWQMVGEAAISGATAFSALLEWEEDAGSDWHDIKFYLEAPDGTIYGYGGDTPDGGCYQSYSRKRYVAVPSDLSQNGTWTAYAWNDDPAVSYTFEMRTITEPKSVLDITKEAAIAFVDNADWRDTDFTGLVSFADNAKVDQPLTSNRIAVKNKINALRASGNTAMGEGIYEATDELQETPVGHARPGSMRFQVLISDGSSNRGRSPEDAANDALANSIKIFTVGIGPEVDENTLRSVASITGGEYYYADDENVLKDIYAIIAAEIQHISSAATRIVVPVPEGAVVADSGTGIVSDGNIVYEGFTMKPGEMWYGSYILNFPCSSAFNCYRSELIVPGEGAMLTYTNLSGSEYEVPFDVNVLLKFLTRDLAVDIFGGRLLSRNNLYLDINVSNTGDLSTGETSLRLRHDDINGTLLITDEVPELCSSADDNCLNSYRIYRNVNIKEEGVIYAIINEDSEISECPLRNHDAINCYGGPFIQFFAVDYYVWVK
jgi:uncharacterized protein YegL